MRVTRADVYNADQVYDALTTLYNCADVDVHDRGPNIRSTWTYLGLQNLDVSLNSLSASVTVKNPASDLVRLQFMLTGNIRVSHDASQYLAVPGSTILLPTEVDIRREISADFSQYILRIHAEELQKKLAALIGGPVNRPIKFAYGTGEQIPAMQRLRRMVEYLIREETDDSSMMPALQAAEFEQLLIVAFLAANRNNFSEALERPTRLPAPWQVRLVEDYIEANWDRALSIEEIADQTGTAVRSIFWAFKKARDYSPIAFLQQVRLRHAREMLRNPVQSTTVSAIALLCGFQNLGHFARYYRTAYGELPSETLRAAKGPGNPN